MKSPVPQDLTAPPTVTWQVTCRQALLCTPVEGTRAAVSRELDPVKEGQ